MGRIPTKAGVPMVPLLGMLMVVAIISMFAGLAWAALAMPAWAVMAFITRDDPWRFRIVGLWLQTTARNLPRLRHWGASRYALLNPAERRELWDRK